MDNESITKTVMNELKDYITNVVENADKWITIKPHGEDNPDYRRLKLEDGETPKEAIDRVYKKEDEKDKNVLHKKEIEKGFKLKQPEDFNSKAEYDKYIMDFIATEMKKNREKKPEKELKTLTEKEKEEIEKLEKDKENYKEKLKQAEEEETEKLSRLGWGTNMRGYKKVSQLSTSKSDKYKNKISEIDDKINKIKYQDVKQEPKKEEKTTKYKKGNEIYNLGKIEEIYHNKNIVQYKINGNWFAEKVLDENKMNEWLSKLTKSKVQDLVNDKKNWFKNKEKLQKIYETWQSKSGNEKMPNFKVFMEDGHIMHNISDILQEISKQKANNSFKLHTYIEY